MILKYNIFLQNKVNLSLILRRNTRLIYRARSPLTISCLSLAIGDSMYRRVLDIENFPDQ